MALALGLVGSVYGALGAIRVTETAMNTIWDVPRKHWPNVFASILRALGMLVVFGILTVASALASGIAAGSPLSVRLRIAGITFSLALNVVLFLCAFRILTARPLAWKDIWVGAVGAAAMWTALESAGGIYVSHVLRHSTELYGFFGIDIALLVWIYVGAQITLYGAETNVVRAKHLWPRRMVQPPLNEGDERALRAYAGREERRPEEHVEVRFDREGTQSGPGR